MEKRYSDDVTFRKGGHVDRLHKREERIRSKDMRERGSKYSRDTGDLVHSRAGDTGAQARSKALAHKKNPRPQTKAFSHDGKISHLKINYKD